MFPPEIWFLILTLLPVKTLLMLRSVCKSFLSIIDDSNFTSSHLRRVPGNLHETRFLILQPNFDRSLYEVREINNNADIIQNNEPWLQTGWWFIGGSLDGLILLLSTHLNDNGSRIAVLWNPSVRKHRQLSLPSSSSKVMYFGLGYSQSSKDYKVVAMSLDRVWLYSLKTNSFTEIFDSGFHRKFGGETIYTQGVSFEQGVVWIEYCISRPCSIYAPRLACFDFGTEKFRYADEMPFSNARKFPKIYNSLVMLDGGSTLGLWVFDVEECAFIWALEANTMTWNKRYKIARGMLPLGVVTTLQLFETKGILTCAYKMCEHRTVKVLSYDLELHTIKYHENFTQSANINMCLYFESLLMLN